MCQQDSIHLRSLEHIDILALLLLVSHIINDFLFRLFLYRLSVLVKHFTFYLFGLVNHLGLHFLTVLVYRSGCCLTGLSIPGACFCLFSLLIITSGCFVFRLFSIVTGVFLHLVRINLIHLKALRQRHINTVQILEKNIVRHLLTELIVFQTAKLDERTDVIPVFLILLFLGLAHAGQLIRHLFRDILADLLNETVILQRTSGYVKRQIGTVDHTF